mmetsp:Transcript_27782/g.89502  ORF Transcript_27782/g.89502 Transcript_27782/m.89502 type:complete len:269 (+) Transcript_27782:379-1185(+)
MRMRLVLRDGHHGVQRRRCVQLRLLQHTLLHAADRPVHVHLRGVRHLLLQADGLPGGPVPERELVRELPQGHLSRHPRRAVCVGLYRLPGWQVWQLGGDDLLLLLWLLRQGPLLSRGLHVQHPGNLPRGHLWLHHGTGRRLLLRPVRRGLLLPRGLHLVSAVGQLVSRRPLRLRWADVRRLLGAVYGRLLLPRRLLLVAPAPLRQRSGVLPAGVGGAGGCQHRLLHHWRRDGPGHHAGHLSAWHLLLQRRLVRLPGRHLRLHHRPLVR